ncbi:hypothetical protein CM19_08260 [Candidatus Acidianus copahuensis]|uniref:DUF1641 domain-containing protein n=2 Tax=Acidianus TaxID=12914 RepID=A0A031LNH3_9CREN|nr:hypothetical protein CM19_08260 [Candidatus Acidianus copahuensis]
MKILSELELSALDNILSQDKLLTLNHFLEMLEKLDKLGIIDVVNGVLDDEEFIGKIMSAVVNDKTLQLITEWNKMSGLLDLMTKGNVSEDLNYVIRLLDNLRDSGILEPIIGMLSDEEFIGKIMNALINDKTMELATKWDDVIGLVNMLSDKDTTESLKSVLDMIKTMNKIGILDPIKGMLSDEETMGKIMGGLVNDFTMSVLSNWNNITKDLGKLNLENFKYYVHLINSIGEAISTEKVKPVGLGGLLSALRDPEVQKGLGVVIDILKKIGQNYKS